MKREKESFKIHGFIMPRASFSHTIQTGLRGEKFKHSSVLHGKKKKSIPAKTFIDRNNNFSFRSDVNETGEINLSTND